MELYIVPILEDNFAYIITDNSHGLVIDPGDGQPVIEFLEKNEIPCQTIINTHHHYDHIAGNQVLKEKYHAQLIAPKDPNISGVNREIVDESPLDLGWICFDVFHTPGHTLSHICLYERTQKWLFSGDTLFLFGCGRLFEGSARQMVSSLEKLKQLPDDAKVYCGHEYTLNNLEFCLTQEPNNPQLRLAYEDVKQQRLKGITTMGGFLGIQKKLNPFLRYDEPSFLKSISMKEENPVNVFKYLRLRKDIF